MSRCFVCLYCAVPTVRCQNCNFPTQTLLAALRSDQIRRHKARLESAVKFRQVGRRVGVRSCVCVGACLCVCTSQNEGEGFMCPRRNDSPVTTVPFIVRVCDGCQTSPTADALMCWCRQNVFFECFISSQNKKKRLWVRLAQLRHLFLTLASRA